MGRFENTTKWQDDVPPDLIRPVEVLRESFDLAHFAYGNTSAKFCYAALHDTPIDDPTREHFNFLMHMKAVIGAIATKRFHELVRQNTPPALFKGFMDLYLDCLTQEALRIFQELLLIGRAHQKALATPYVDWAQAQCLHMVEYHRHRVRNWVQRVCDVQPYDPSDDSDEWIYWRKWQPPMFLPMKPSRYAPFEAGTAWNRADAETGQRWLDRFADDYVLHLEMRVKKAAGIAILERAKKPQPVESLSPNGSAGAAGPAPVTNSRIEARKRKTQARNKRWWKKYRELKKARPDMSDAWYAQQIAKLPIADGCSVETIRKQMKGQKVGRKPFRPIRPK